VDYRQPTTAAIEWSASTNDAGDTVRYKVLLMGAVTDSNLLTLKDTLTNLSPNKSYAGEVIAYDKYNDTVSAPFTLGQLSGYALFFGPDGDLDLTNLFADQFVWNAPAGSGGQWTGVPLIVGDTVYADYNFTSTYAYNLLSGQLVWSNTSPSGGDDENLYYGGPVYANGNLYVSYYTGGSGLKCLNLKGQILWNVQDGNTFCTTPVVDNNIVFAGSYSGNAPGSAIYMGAYDAGTGALLWKQQLDNENTPYPIVCNGLVIFGNADDKLYALNESSGSIAWTQAVPGTEFTAPIHYNDLVFTAGSAGLIAVNTTNGAIVWQDVNGKDILHQAPALSHDTLYYFAYGTGSQIDLVAANANSGAKIFQASFTQGYVSTPIVAGGRLYAVGQDGLDIYSATDGSYVGYTVNSHMGAILFNGTVYYPAESGMMQ
jgi:outer membrane protein assembly factor BamB